MKFKQLLKNAVKESRLFYWCYHKIGSIVLKFFGLFIKTDPGLVLFVSYGGRKFDDSPRKIYEYILAHQDMYSELKLIWAFVEPSEYTLKTPTVKIDTVKFYFIALKAGYWITNASVSRGLNFKKKSTRYYLFQHGMTGIKKQGGDVPQNSKLLRAGNDKQEDFDAIFIEGRYEVPILSEAWEYPAERFIKIGLPRNDDLVKITDEEVRDLKNRLSIPVEKKVILYAPTYREYLKDTRLNAVLSLPFTFEKWKKELSDEYVLLLTAHYEVVKLLGDIPNDGFTINAFQYPIINDLLKVSDILITDYSSVCWDYSILGRPIYCYGYDYDAYMKERGTYLDLEMLFSHGVIRDEDALLKAIKNIDYEAESQYTKHNIRDRYLVAYGNATERAVQYIFNHS